MEQTSNCNKKKVEQEDMKPFVEYHKNWLIWALAIAALLMVCSVARAEQPIKASWYSVASLKKEGSWKIWKGVCADGSQFNDNNLTCASRMHKLGAMLKVTNLSNGKSVVVKVSDRIGKRFAETRIDLTPRAFAEIATLKQGLVEVSIEVLLCRNVADMKC